MNYSDVFLERLCRLVAQRLTDPVSLGHLARMDTDELRLVAAREAASPVLTAQIPRLVPLAVHSASGGESKA